MNRRVLGFLALLALVSVAAEAARETPLVAAAQTGDLKAVRAVLARNVDVNAPSPDGMTALHWAVQGDDVTIVDALLTAGANARATTAYGIEPISLAAIRSITPIIERLLDAGADSNVAMPTGETPLMQAARNGNADTVKVLLAHGASVDAKETTQHQTALMWAAVEGNVAAIKTLIEGGANIDAHSKMRAPRPPRTPSAATKPKPRASTAPPAASAGGNPLVLWNLYPNGRDVSRSAFGARTVTEGLTPLLFATRQGHIDVVRLLLDEGAKIDEPASDGSTALFLAIVNAHWELAAFLLERGADPNTDGRGITPLHQLVVTRRLHLGHLPHPLQSGRMNSIEFTKLLVAKGADLNARMTVPGMGDGYRNRMNRADSTPFLLAAKGIDPEMMRLLVSLGADPTIPNVENTTALMLAAGVHQYNPGEDAGTEQESLEAVQYCVSLGLDVNAIDDNGETALHGSAYKGFNLVAEYLVEQGAKLDVRNVLGWTPLTIANGVMYTNFYKSQRHTAALLVKLMTDRGIEASDALDVTGAGYVTDLKEKQEFTVPVADSAR